MTQLTPNLYAVEAPIDATEIQNWNHGIGFKTKMLDRKPDDTNGFYHIETGLFKMKGFKILGEVTKDEINFNCDDVVENPEEIYVEDWDGNLNLELNYFDYEVEKFFLLTANESFLSLLQSKGIDLNKENVKLIILEKL